MSDRGRGKPFHQRLVRNIAGLGHHLRPKRLHGRSNLRKLIFENIGEYKTRAFGGKPLGCKPAKAPACSRYKNASTLVTPLAHRPLLIVTPESACAYPGSLNLKKIPDSRKRLPG
jgi:hypothetical protein